MSDCAHIPLSAKRMSFFRNLAVGYFDQQNVAVSVKPIKSIHGPVLYGILIHHGSAGHRQWYSDDSNDDHILTWENKTDAECDLEAYILPNLGLMIHQNRVLKFQSLC